MDAKSKLFNFEDREESYTSNNMHFERHIHWCTKNHLCTSSFMHQEDYQEGSYQEHFCIKDDQI